MDKELKKIVELALSEDIGSGDLSSSLLDDVIINAEIICRDRAIICGTEYFDLCFLSLDKDIQIKWNLKDGDEVKPGEVICNIKGKSRAIITAERTALNFLQILSGTSTKTNYLVSLISETKAQLLDTRKTIPGLRVAQKYAVHVGGAFNQRFGLYDKVLIKENHIKSIGSISQIIKIAKKKYPLKDVQIEVENLKEFKEAIELGATNILLDNFSLKKLSKAVQINKKKAVLEASGDIDINNIIDFAKTKVDRISIGALTKNIKAVDFSMSVRIN